MLRSCTLFFDASSSPKKIMPSVGLSSPATSLSSVVLPEPEGPRSAINSPERIVERNVFESREAAEFLTEVLDANVHGCIRLSMSPASNKRVSCRKGQIHLLTSPGLSPRDL